MSWRCERRQNIRGDLQNRSVRAARKSELVKDSNHQNFKLLWSSFLSHCVVTGSKACRGAQRHTNSCELLPVSWCLIYSMTCCNACFSLGRGVMWSIISKKLANFYRIIVIKVLMLKCILIQAVFIPNSTFAFCCVIYSKNWKWLWSRNSKRRWG